MAFAGVELRYVTLNLKGFGNIISDIEKIRFSTHHAGYTVVSRGGSASYSLSLVLADGRPTGLVLAARYLVRRCEEFYEIKMFSKQKSTSFDFSYFAELFVQTMYSTSSL